MTTGDLRPAVIRLLDELVTPGSVAVDAGVEMTVIRLSPVPGAEYCFVIEVEDEEATIRAERPGAPSDEYFWYRPFEDWHATPSASLEVQLLDVLRRLLTHDTRIVQRRGFLFWHFRGEAAVPDANGQSAWVSVYDNAVLRGTRGIPVISGAERVYLAPATVVDPGDRERTA